MSPSTTTPVVLPTHSSFKIVRSGQNESRWALGQKFTFLLGPEDTHGEFVLSELVAQPRNGPPPHLHRRDDELFYVLDGEFVFASGGRSFTRSKGFAVYLPKNTLHTYDSVGPRPGRMLVINAPSGFERFIYEWSRPVRDPAEPPPPATQQDIDALLAAAPKYGIELHPDAHFEPDPSPPPPDRAYWVLGQRVTFKLTGQDTAGNFSVVEVTSNPGEGVPLHWHHAMDELFYVLEGAFQFTFDRRAKRVEAGDLVYVPRGSVHGFRNIGLTPGRLFDVHTPAGFEAFFEEAGVPATDFTTPPPPPPDTDRLLELFHKHGMELILP